MRTSKTKRTGWCLGAGLGALLLCGLVQELRAATATNAQASGSTDYWTNNAAWTAGSYPGSAAGESAYLITNMAGSATTLLDATLPGALTTLTLSNASGEVWLVVTNAALTNTTLNIRAGGRLQIANGGLVTNTAALSMGGTGGRVYVNGGGSWYAGAATIGSAVSNNLVSVGDATGLSALWNLRAGALTIGSGTKGNMVQVGEGGLVTNISLLYVGNNAGAQLNGLVITNGGRAYLMGVNQPAYIGLSGASNNYVIVEGSNSAGSATLSFVDSRLYVGHTGAARGNWLRVGAGGLVSLQSSGQAGLVVGYVCAGYNYMIVTNGGQLIRSGSTANPNKIGVNSSNNYVIVTGTNGTLSSTWNGGANNSLVIGENGTGNWMRVDTGGLATNFTTVTVGTGGGAQYNSLTITNGGRLFSVGAVAIGDVSSSNNSIVVAGSDGNQPAVWSAGGQTLSLGVGTAAGNVLRIGNGGLLTNAQVSFTTPTPDNAMVVENGGQSFAGLSIGGTNVGNPSITVSGVSLWEPGSDWNAGGRSLGVGETAGSIGGLMTLNGRTFSSFTTVRVGYGAGTRNHRLVLTNSAKLYAGGAGNIGYTTAAGTNNAVLVMGGAGEFTLWNNGGGTLTVGSGASTNSSLIVDGQDAAELGSASLENFGALSVGGNASSSVLLTNRASFFSVSGNTTLNGTSNRIEVVKGSKMSVSVGATDTGPKIGNLCNLLRVSGSNSVLEGLGAAGGNKLVVSESNNTVRIEEGGLVTNMNVVLGSTAAAVGNLLSITDGGKLYSFSAASYIGGAATAVANTGLVVGENSLWDVGSLGLGMSGKSNLLAIADSAVVSNVTTLLVGSGAGGSFNTAVITNGGKLFTTGASTLANTAGQVSNTVLVTGGASAWSLGGSTLTIGLATTTNNVLTIEQGGTVDNIGTLTINPNNALIFKGGTLSLANAMVRGNLFEVGDGTQPALLKTLGGGACVFTNGLRVNNGATLMGSGIVAGGTPGVTLDNGGTLSAGLNGVGTLALSNTVWNGGGTNLVEISAVDGLPGLGYDTLAISATLTLTANGGKFVVRMDSLGGGANFQADQDYLLKFASYGTSTVNPADFQVDTGSFTPGGAWWVTNSGNSLYLAHTGATAVVAGYVWDPAKSGNWSSNETWLGSVAPANGGSATNVLEYGGSGTASYTATNNLGNDHLLNRLLLSSTSTGTNILRGQSLLISGSGSGIALEGSGWTLSTNRLSWTEPLLLAGNSPNGGVILANTLAGTGAVTVAAQGTYVLGTSNTFSGEVVVNCPGDGRLTVNGAGGLGKNSVTVSNGTLHINNAAFVFGGSNQPNLRALVAGAGSLWTNNGTLTAGAQGSTNVSLTVNAGRLQGGALYAGGQGSTNCLLLITNGARVVTTGTSVIGDLGSSGDAAIVTGSGSIWNCASLTVAGSGAASAGHVLRIVEGGIVTNCSALNVGNAQSGNALIITNNGRFYSPRGSFTLGVGTASNNTALISGSGSLLSGTLWNNNAFTIGSGTPAVLCGNNVVTISDGACVEEFNILIGSGLNYRSRLVVDNAAIGKPAGTSPVYVGNGGCGNTMLVTNGGLVYGSIYVGQGVGTNNTLLAVGSTSRLIGTLLNIGNGANSGSNQMILDAGSMSNYSVTVGGAFAGTLQNSLILTNGARAWLGSSGLTLASGTGSSRNWVGIYSDAVVDALGYPVSIGTGVGTWSNSLIVGVGGTVNNVGTLKVGNATGTNQLLLCGGTLTVTNLVCTNANNTITFSAGNLNVRGSQLSNAVPFSVGDGTQAAMLNLLPGGTNIFRGGLTIATNATLTGIGTILAATTVDGTNSPGSGVGTLSNIGDFTLTARAVSKIEIASNTTAGVGWDLLAVTNGTLTLGGKLVPILTGGFAPTDTMSFVIMASATPGINGSFINTVAGRVNVYTNNLPTSIVGNFRVTVSNGQYVVLDNFKPAVALGPVIKLW